MIDDYLPNLDAYKDSGPKNISQWTEIVTFQSIRHFLDFL
jgi:hypothetical protein